MACATAELVRKALDEAFAESVKGLYASAWANAAGGDIDAAMKRFDAGLMLDMATVHARVVADVERILKT